MATVRLRFFASARAAVGHSEIVLKYHNPTDIETALLEATSNDPQLVAVLARCSFLVNGVATTHRQHSLAAGDLVDVLPPFAGG